MENLQTTQNDLQRFYEPSGFLEDSTIYRCQRTIAQQPFYPVGALSESYEYYTRFANKFKEKGDG